MSSQETVVCVQQHCIYCDSRSECYRIEDFDGEVLAKISASELLRRELVSKRVATKSPLYAPQTAEQLSLFG